MGPAAVVVLLVVMTAGTALAQVRPEPTQHARDELANAVAQGRVTLTPTPTMTSTPRPSPAPTQAPTASPTQVAVEDLIAPPLLPALPLPDAAAGPQPVYLLPSDDWAVLATVFGRWAVRFGDCEPLPLLTDLVIDPLPADGVPDLALLDGSARCQLVQWTWLSSNPCAQDATGACSVVMDPLFPSPPTETPTPVVIYVQVPVAAEASAPPARAPPPAAAPVPRPDPPTPTERPAPTDTATPLPTHTPLPTRTPVLTRTPLPTRTPVVTPEPTGTPDPSVAASARPPRPPRQWGTPWGWIADRTVDLAGAIVGLAVGTWLLLAAAAGLASNLSWLVGMLVLGLAVVLPLVAIAGAVLRAREERQRRYGT